MDFYDALNSLSAKIRQQSDRIATEEATKTAFVMPFIQTVLGYDVFNPSEVVPEFVCDIGTKKAKRSTMRFSRTTSFRCSSSARKLANR